MRVVRNVGYIKRRRRLAGWSAFFGFVLLASTFFLVLSPRLIAFAYALLFTGFILFNFGMQQVGKWRRNPRNDVLLDERLKSLSDKYTLIHYATFGRRAVEHMLIHPGGVLVLTARELPGEIVSRNNRWRRKGLGLTRLFGLSGPQLGNPSYETRQSVATVEGQLTAAQLEVEVEGAIAFLNPSVQLDVENSDYPALPADELAEFVSTLPPDDSLRPNERQALVETLAKGEQLEVTDQKSARRPVRTKRPVKKRAA
jgi:hypothetical protein